MSAFVCVLTFGMLLGPGSEVVVDAGFRAYNPVGNRFYWQPQPVHLLVTAEPGPGPGLRVAWSLSGMIYSSYGHPVGRGYVLDPQRLTWWHLRRLCPPGCDGDS